LDTSINPFLVSTSAGEVHSDGIATAPNKSSLQKASFLAQFTSLLGKTLGAGAGIAASVALPGVGGAALGASSDKLVQSLVKNLSPNSLGSSGSSIQIARQNEFRAPETLSSQNLGFLQAASNPYIAAQNKFLPVNPSSVSLRV
jgi:hypothetical protein